MAFCPGTVGLIVGKSSTTIRGLQVYPGVINEDYTGEIKIKTQAPGAFVAVSLEIKIAQLVILPNVKKSKMLTHTLWRVEHSVPLIMSTGYNK
jgi:dUTPase